MEVRLNAANVIKMVPGPTTYTVSHVQDIKSAFELFVTPSIQQHIPESLNIIHVSVFDKTCCFSYGHTALNAPDCDVTIVRLWLQKWERERLSRCLFLFSFDCLLYSSVTFVVIHLLFVFFLP